MDDDPHRLQATAETCRRLGLVNDLETVARADSFGGASA
jgi:hypothetical protein